MNRTAVLLVGALAVVGATAPSSGAAPKPKPKPKPITKTYTATAPVPDPTNVAGQGYTVCAMTLPQSFQKEAFRVPAAGTLVVTATEYGPDWDLLLLDSKDEEIGSAGSAEDFQPETMSVRFKKAQDVTIVACNWAGTPTAKISYTFTYK